MMDYFVFNSNDQLIASGETPGLVTVYLSMGSLIEGLTADGVVYSGVTIQLAHEGVLMGQAVRSTLSGSGYTWQVDDYITTERYNPRAQLPTQAPLTR